MDQIPLSDIIRAAGGVNALARVLGVTPAAVSLWRRSRKGVPAERVQDVARAARISPSSIRPDLYPVPQADHSAQAAA